MRVTEKKAAISNFRDVGGLQAISGQQLQNGILFRSAAIAKLDDATAELLMETSVKNVIDLRTQGERAMTPDALPEGINAVTLDVLGSDPTSASASLTAILANPDKAKALSAVDAEAMLEASYRSFVSLHSATTAYRQLFSLIASTDANNASLMHCTAGKDRTGWAAAALQLWLGVPEAAVYEEYLRSNTELGDLQPIIDWFTNGGGDPDAIQALLAVKAEYLDAALDEVRRTHGDIDAYFSRGLELPTSELVALRNKFLPQ